MTALWLAPADTNNSAQHARHHHGQGITAKDGQRKGRGRKEGAAEHEEQENECHQKTVEEPAGLGGLGGGKGSKENADG